MKDIKSYVIGFLSCACLFLIMGQTKSDKKEVIMQIESMSDWEGNQLLGTISNIHYYNKFEDNIEYVKTEKYSPLNEDSFFLLSEGYGSRDGEKGSRDGKEGKWTDYYRNGKIEREGNYKDGSFDGKWTYYDLNGQIEWEGNYKDGWKDGKWTFYNKDGSIKGVDEYRNGKFVK